MQKKYKIVIKNIDIYPIHSLTENTIKHKGLQYVLRFDDAYKDFLYACLSFTEGI